MKRWSVRLIGIETRRSPASCVLGDVIDRSWLLLRMDDPDQEVVTRDQPCDLDSPLDISFRAAMTTVFDEAIRACRHRQARFMRVAPQARVSALALVNDHFGLFRPLCIVYNERSGALRMHVRPTAARVIG